MEEWVREGKLVLLVYKNSKAKRKNWGWQLVDLDERKQLSITLGYFCKNKFGRTPITSLKLLLKVGRLS